VDRDHDASLARIRLTGSGPILYRSIVAEIGRPQEGGRVAAGNRETIVTFGGLAALLRFLDDADNPARSSP
jgi:hypothetical protein